MRFGIWIENDENFTAISETYIAGLLSVILLGRDEVMIRY